MGHIINKKQSIYVQCATKNEKYYPKLSCIQSRQYTRTSMASHPMPSAAQQPSKVRFFRQEDCMFAIIGEQRMSQPTAYTDYSIRVDNRANDFDDTRPFWVSSRRRTTKWIFCDSTTRTPIAISSSDLRRNDDRPELEGLRRQRSINLRIKATTRSI